MTVDDRCTGARVRSGILNKTQPRETFYNTAQEMTEAYFERRWVALGSTSAELIANCLRMEDRQGV